MEIIINKNRLLANIIYHNIVTYVQHVMAFGLIYYLPSGGSRISHRGGHAPIGGHGPPTWALFGENVCENETIGSHGGCAPGTPPRSANVAYI